MRFYQVSYSSIIPAPPANVHGVIADYKVGHPAILPKPYFGDLTVEAGGFGAGSVIRFPMEVMGVKVQYHMDVTEPEPGKLLREKDRATGVYTDFIFKPHANGSQTELTFTTHMPQKPGLGGLIEKWITPPVMRRIYKQEMENITAYVQREKA